MSLHVNELIDRIVSANARDMKSEHQYHHDFKKYPYLYPLKAG